MNIPDWAISLYMLNGLTLAYVASKERGKPHGVWSLYVALLLVLYLLKRIQQWTS